MFILDGELISDHVRRKQDISEMGDHFLKELVLGCLENDSKQRPDLKNIKVELEGRKWMVVQRSKSCGQDKEIKIEKVGLQPLYDYKLKVLFIGDNGVGKTCLFNRFNNPFCNALLSTSTLSPDLNTESFKYGSKFVRLVLIDTPSDKLLFSTSAPFYGYVHGIFLVCDVTRHKSFENISRWLDLFRKYCSESNAIVIIIGNKVDQAKKCEVSFEEGHALAKSHGLSYMEASALEVGSIEEMFKTMIQLLTRSVDQGLKKIELDDATGKVKLKKGRPGKSKSKYSKA